MHSSCTGRGWQEFRAKIGKPETHQYDPPPAGRPPSPSQPGSGSPILAEALLDHARDCHRAGGSLREALEKVRQYNRDFGHPPLPEADADSIAMIPFRAVC